MDINEKQFEAQIKDLVKILHYDLYYHTHRSQFSPAGFPDCVIGRTEPPMRLIVAELKVGKNQPTPEQYFWIMFFQMLGELTEGLVDGFLWYPEDIEEIAQILR